MLGKSFKTCVLSYFEFLLVHTVWSDIRKDQKFHKLIYLALFDKSFIAALWIEAKNLVRKQ